jgi:NAD(P)-dependent dehydrogenase (short-subunit alcohol dehydrogenase family)
MVDWATAGEAIAASLGPNATFYKIDVASWDDQAACFRTTWERYRRLDFLAANAGIDDKDSLYRETLEERERGPQKPNLVTLDVDLKGPIYGLKLAAYYMRRNKNKGGCVVMTSSMMGLYPFALNPQYCAAKHGVSAASFLCLFPMSCIRSLYALRTPSC